LINTTGGIKRGRADPAPLLEEQTIAKELELKMIPTNWPAEIATTRQSNGSKQITKTHMDQLSSDLNRLSSGSLNWGLGQKA